MESRRDVSRRSCSYRSLPTTEPLESRLLLDGVMLGDAQASGAGLSPNSLVCGDFNGDGRPDLVVMDAGNGSTTQDALALLLGQGDGSFVRTDSYFLWNPGRLTAGDFNGDGCCDVAVTIAVKKLVIVLGQPDGTLAGAGTWTNPDTHGGPVTAGDFNGDGKLDVVTGIGSTIDKSVNVFLGQGDGTVGNRVMTPLSMPIMAIVAGDFNSDGLSDVAVSSGNGNQVQVLLRAAGGAAFETPVTYGFPGYASSLLYDDFTGDGVADLAVGTSTTTSILSGAGDGTFGAAATYSVAGLQDAADINGDGRLDLIGVSGGQVGVDYGLPGGGFGYGESYAVGSPDAAVVADFDGDGLPDVAIADATQQVVRTLANQGVQPDLIVDVTLIPADVQPDGWVDVEVNVDNIGYGSSTPANIEIYLSTDATIDASDTLIGSFATDAMANWTRFRQTVGFNAPAAGIYCVGAVADRPNVLVETYEHNNTGPAHTLMVGADLSILPVTDAFAAAPGDTVDVPLRVANAANVDAAACRVVLEMAPTSDLSAGVTTVGQFTLADVGADDAIDRTVSFAAPAAPGRYYLRAAADVDGNVAEYDETNNVGPVMTLTVGADLTITLSGGAAAPAGREMDVSVAIANNSPVAVAQTFTVQLYLSADAVLDAADTPIGSYTCGGIAAWGASSRAVPFTAPEGVGEHIVIGVVDPDGVVAEAPENLANNIDAASVYVTPSYDLLQTSMLKPGVRWTYDFEIGEFQNKPLDRTSVATVSVSGGPTIGGIATYRMTHAVPKLYSEWEYVARDLDGYVMMGFGTPECAFTATEPLMVMPPSIAESDYSLHLDHGTFTGNIEGTKLILQADSYVSFEGTETLVLPSGTFECTIVGVDLYFQMSNGWSASQHLTWWIDPDAGPIRRDYWDSTECHFLNGP
ncbi:MAG: hypothetical protein GX591_18080 [Planctomycetes bacterium]|nr:hypothetical protein [Planctomycetota bacterium]